MVDLMSRYWWAVGLRGLSAVDLGVIALISPSATLVRLELGAANLTVR